MQLAVYNLFLLKNRQIYECASKINSLEVSRVHGTLRIIKY